ncbi:carboxymuconolactone decarboxylase family protein [Actinomycetota bacterium Odt1-20B]
MSEGRDGPRYQRGFATLCSLVGEERTNGFIEELDRTSPALTEQVVCLLYGQLHHRQDLEPATRELVTLAVMATLGGCEPQVRQHVTLALKCGASPVAITGVFLQVAAHAGIPRALNAVAVAHDVFEALALLPLGTAETSS